LKWPRPVLARLFEQQFGIVAGGQPSSRMRSGKSSATLTVLVPMEPVLPSKTTFFISTLIPRDCSSTCIAR
jgi:hypothetical protein